MIENVVNLFKLIFRAFNRLYGPRRSKADQIEQYSPDPQGEVVAETARTITMGSSSLTVPQTIQALQISVQDAQVPNNSGQTFLPEGEIVQLLSSVNLGTLLPSASRELVEFIRTKAWRVFLAALMSHEWGEPRLIQVFESFLRDDFTDELLPLGDTKGDVERESTTGNPEKIRKDKAMTVISDRALWGILGTKNFIQNQWKVIVPVFKKANLGQLMKELPKETILPFTYQASSGYSGHFSDVVEARVHADHQDKLDPDASKKDVQVALKMLKSTIQGEDDYKVEQNWQREADTLNKLGGLNHPHLIRHISSFKWAGTHYIMFEWADDGTLRSFWAKDRKAHEQLSGDRIKEFLTQFCGLTEALCQLHNTDTQRSIGHAEDIQEMTSPSQTGGEGLNSESGPRDSSVPDNGGDVPEILVQGDGTEISNNGNKHWRHGDLKPENILVFKRESSWLGTLKIADLGLAKQHESATQFRPGVTATKHTTQRYEAPEVFTNRNGPRSRLYDIWSVGCILLESVIWLLYGYKGLETFYQGERNLNPQTDQTIYFTIGNGSNTIVSVSDTARLWMEEMLKEDPELKDSTALKGLLSLVKEKLLVVDVSNRADALVLHQELEKIKAAAATSPTYLFTGRSRANIEIPASLLKPIEATPRLRTQRSRNLLEVRSAQNPMLDSKWEVQPVDSISKGSVATAGRDKLSTFTDGSATLCQHCLSSNFGALGLLRIENEASLSQRKEICRMCEILLKILNKSNLFKTDDTTTDTILDPQAQNIPPEIPKVAAIGSPTYFNILRGWLDDCDQNHGNGHDNCRPKVVESSPIKIPTRLIDVGKGYSPSVYLKQSGEIDKTRQEFIALSHPWGDKDKHSHYCTTRQNISDHRNGIKVDSLPSTFKHAIEVTRQLGLRYLWIDSLCIIQGEGGDFDEQAKLMETVFSSAYCVIAATCAKGMSSGFLNSRRREIFRFEKPGESAVYVCEPIDNFQLEVIEGPLNKRGWVLQERALARRTIYFAENQTYWECGYGVRCETSTRMKNNQAAFLGDPQFPRMAMESTKGGQIRLYELLYKQYSRLDFTKIHDRPLAIAGIEQRLIRAFETQGGYGVFTRYFGRSLLWQRGETLLEPIQFPQSQPYQVPSWSWMAYKGAIDFMNLPFGEVEWEQKEIRSPWSPPTPTLASSSRLNTTHSTGWHTAATNGKNDLMATARDFSVAADCHIIYDRGEGPKDRVVKCVIVGRSKVAMGANRTHYVLVIAKKKDGGSYSRYERIGVAELPGNLITLDEVGLQVEVS
ncbi:hypothetical protein O1611_g71 [Lasiodiplodia mahajangana]|uniref:Uncharacterized protein n=1 Tax=Lasiodiplodia mahajangana TaxID=1108764 RepID=A0ACC2K1K4_9PEZI|nr:hypothetical protein O1611_g71 [Lasiodiplodia mahajangana]